MKKILSLILSFLLIFTFISCGEKELIKTEDEAMDKLFEKIKDDLAIPETALVSYGNDEVDGKPAWKFAWGKNTIEKFTAEIFYSVTEEGKIYKINIEGDYELLK